MTKTELKADKREEIGKKNKNVRAKGLVPAVVYGRKFKPASISVVARDFSKKVLESESGSNLIFNLKMNVDGKSRAVPVITHSVQRDPLNDALIHIDFMHVIMDEAIKTKVPVELVGIAIGVKEAEGVLVHGLREIEVKCLPGDIPSKFEIDVSNLEINNSLHVSDLKVSKKVELLAEPTEMVATVSPPTKEEEVAPPPLTPEEVEAAAAAAEAGEAGEGAPAAEAAEAGKAKPEAESKEKAPAAAPGKKPAAAEAKKEAKK